MLLPVQLGSAQVVILLAKLALDLQVLTVFHAVEIYFIIPRAMSAHPPVQMASLLILSTTSVLSATPVVRRVMKAQVLIVLLARLRSFIRLPQGNA